MAVAAVDPAGLYAEPPFEQEDVIYPCKACGEILEEGKAYELAGNRWHIDCFRCNTCGTLLDSDANLLLLGDGSLICNNCTYSCSACGNKIEDLAILTGDQAFCSGCFRCRNCKRKIENLRYARTSQGIFCMSCHESLMARRRKKSKGTSKTGQNGSASTSTKEKALPSLPATNVPASAFSPDLDSPEVETPDTLGGPPSPADRSVRARTDAPRGDAARNVSPLPGDARAGDSLTLPASTYGDPKRSSAPRDSHDGPEMDFLPMALDPNPVSGPPVTRKQPVADNTSPLPQSDSRPPRDYFSGTSTKSTHRDLLRDDGRSPRSLSTERDRERTPSAARNSPHILYQEKGRVPSRRDLSSNNTPALSTAVSPAIPSASEKSERSQGQPLDPSSAVSSQSGGFKMGDVTVTRKPVSKPGSKNESPVEANAKESLGDSPDLGVNPFDDPKRRDAAGDRPVRGDSLTAGSRKGRQTTEEQSATGAAGGLLAPDRRESGQSSLADALSGTPVNASYNKSTDSPASSKDFDAPPPRSSSRPIAAGTAAAADELGALRVPTSKHRAMGSIGSIDGPGTPKARSPALPKRSLDGSFSMEEEMSRILRGEPRTEAQATEGAPSVLRKMSNAVRHGRSFSDRGLSSAGRTSANGVGDTSSPVSISSPLQSRFSGRDSPESLLAQIRRSNQRIGELEAANAALEEKVHSSIEIKTANNELREKRTTMVVLDTQREMVVRELEAMTEHLSRAKNSNEPLDLTALKTDILKDFASSLQKLKDQMSFQIEDLMHRRNELTAEIGNLIAMKDKGFQEFETLSSKNAQLQEMNAQIMQNIQDVYKANRSPNGSSTNGLGIYNGGPRPEISAPSEVRNLNLINTGPGMPNLLQETEADDAAVLTAPQVVSIRKGQQPKRFNWRRGGEKVAKNVTKGIKGAFGKEENALPYGSNAALASNGSDPYGLLSASSTRSGSEATTKAGSTPFGFFGQKGAARPGVESAKSSENLDAPLDASVLFGSDLDARCEYERRVVPAIVTRCIEEVEARGMDMEGIYRKSGGSGQVKAVQQAFERDGGGADISDPDLDIHAVTSALKQYFRKLPIPLVTYDAYEALLEAGQAPSTGGDAEAAAAAAGLRTAVAELPDAHRSCLELLLQHLGRVAARQATNLMTPLNLAVVFAPTIMRPLSIEREMSDMQAQRAAVQALLELRDLVFVDDE